MAVTTAALLGGNILAGLGQGLIGSYQENRRQQEWNQMFGLKEQQFQWQKEHQGKQLGLQERGQNLNAATSIGVAGMQAGGSLIGNILSYKHSQDQLDYQKQLNQQKRDDLTADGLPMSYLHLSGNMRSLPSAPSVRGQSLGRSTESILRPMNQGGQPLSQTFGTFNNVREGQWQTRSETDIYNVE